jgi:hypothetical protein
MTSQHGAYALRAALARLYARMRMHTPTRPRIHMHAQACTHRSICNTYCSPQQQLFRERASVLRDTYTACLVFRYHLQTTYHPMNKMALSPRCSDVHSPSYTPTLRAYGTIPPLTHASSRCRASLSMRTALTSLTSENITRQIGTEVKTHRARKSSGFQWYNKCKAPPPLPYAMKMDGTAT